MMTKNFASNSVLRRASQFESGSSADQQQQQQAQSSGRNIAESTQQSSVSIKRPSLSRRSITKPKDEVDDNVDHVTEDQKAIKTTSTSSNDHQQQPQQNSVFLSSAYARFEREYARLYPDSPAPPFTEPANTEEAAEALRRQQARAAELSLELSKAKFAVNFLKGITSSSSSANADRRDSTATDKGSLNNSAGGSGAAVGASSASLVHFDEASTTTTTTNVTTNGNSSSSSCTAAEASSSSSSSTTNEQYVTVITLNDSTYGEIQRQQPKTAVQQQQHQQEPSEDQVEEGEVMESSAPTKAETKAEPIYLNTLESQKSVTAAAGDKVAKKRPPTPPRKPQFGKAATSSATAATSSAPSKQGNSSSNDNILAAVSAASSASASSSAAVGISKSESLKSMSRLQRKFNGPLQQIGGGGGSDVAKSTTAINQQNSNQQKNSKLAGKSAPPPPPPPYMRTFSQPEPTPSQRAAANDSKDEDGESVGDGMHDEEEVRNTEDEDDEDPNYSDNADNIYDTVAPDQEEEEGEDEYDSEGDLLARDDHHHQQHIPRENLRRADRGEEEEEEGLSSSHEMLSRSSSTDEGLSNYVNIDYFLRKSSLGRSSSNIPGGPSVPSSFPPSRAFRGNGRKKSSLADIETEDTADDAETNLSSMKSSSDYDNSFSSSENIIDGLLPPYHQQQQQHGHGHYQQNQQQQQQNYHHQQQAQQQHQQQSMVNSNSLRSFNSSTLSSTGSASTPSGSLRTRSLKGNTNSNSNDQTNVSPSSTYPPNMSTFTPPIRDRGQAQFTFFKGEKEAQETTTTTDLGAADLPISPIPPPSKVSAAVKQFGGNRDAGGSRKASQASSKSNSTGSVCEYYAYTDILESLPSHERKASSGGVGNELADESLVMENKPLGGGGGGGDNLTESPSLESSKQTSPSSQYNQSSSSSSLSRSEVEQCRTMQWKIIRSIIESETVYLDCLNTLQQYMKALSTTTTNSSSAKSSSSSDKDALLSPEDLRTIFHCIPELYKVHSAFLGGLKAVEHGYKMKLHSESMTGKSKVATKLMTKNSVGELFFRLASNLPIYADFLRNYSRALETAGRCSAQSSKFSEIIKSIKVASLNGGHQTTNLVDLLHKPVARLQKNALVLHDLLKFVDSRNEEEQNLLKEALKMTQAFLNELNLETTSGARGGTVTKSLFPAADKFQRRLVKESFIVEAAGGGGSGGGGHGGGHGDSGRRKLRHLFLFNDVIVCAKYKASTKQKFTFELKWFQMLGDVLLDPSLDSLQHSGANSSSNSGSSLNRSLNSSSTSSNSSSSVAGSPGNSQAAAAAAAAAAAKDSKEAANSLATVESLKSRAFAARYEVFVEERKSSAGKASEKHRKKLSELESELVLWLPQLKFSFALKGSGGGSNSKVQHLFYLSSEYERGWWVDTIRHLQQVLHNSAHNEQVSPIEMQRQIEACRKSMSPSLGSFLLRTNKDESLRFGDLHLRFIHLNGYVPTGRQSLYFVVETDSYGHYFKQAVTRCVTDDDRENINEDFLLELEGTQSLRILAYETAPPKRMIGGGDSDHHHYKHHQQQHPQPTSPPVFKGKATFDLTSACLLPDYAPKELSILEYSLSISLSFTSWKSMMERTPPNRICGTFGLPIATVCKKEGRSKVPLLITCCINEVQRRGLREVGIYRVSGLSSDVAKLRKAFETSPRDACWLIGHVDIHTVTGLLKSYLRELPESLFTNDMYQRYIEARDLKNAEERERRMTTLLSQLPEPNQSTIVSLIDHLVQVNCHEEENKMSLNNLATVFGPTMLKTNTSEGGSGGKGGSKGSSNANASSSSGNSSAGVSGDSPFAINTDLFTASTIDVMAQADIVYFYLRRKSEGLSLTSFDREETSL